MRVMEWIFNYANDLFYSSHARVRRYLRLAQDEENSRSTDLAEKTFENKFVKPEHSENKHWISP